MSLATLASGQALALAVLLATAWAAGRPWLGRPGATDRLPGAAGVGLSLAMGLAVLAQALFVLGLCGGLRAPIVVGLVIAVHLAAVPRWRHAGGTAVAALRRRGGRWGWLVVAGVVLAALPFAMTLYPPLGFDQTLYHLPYAQAFAASGGLPFLPDLRFPVFPQLAEVLAAAVLLLAGEVATQVVGWAALVGCVVLAFGWAREIAATAAGGVLAAAVVVGSPAALYLAATGYVEPVLALFGLGALRAAEQSASALRRGTGGADAGGAVRWAILAGFLAGSAAGVKYLGLLFVPAVGLYFLGGDRRRGRIVALGALGLAAVLALVPSYGRIVALTGNPLFPFYTEIFGASPWSADAFLGPRGGDRLAAAATLLWDATFRRDLVGNLPPYSPALVVALPVGLWAVLRRRRLRPLLATALLFLALAPTNAHYLLAVVPVWAVLVGGGLGSALGGAPTRRRAASTATLLVALAGPLYAAHYLVELGPPPASPAARERFLAGERALFPAVDFLASTDSDAAVYGVHAEWMNGYFPGRWLGDHSGPASYSRLASRSDALGSLAAALEELGAGYLLVPRSREAWERSALAEPRLACVYADAAATIYHLLPAPTTGVAASTAQDAEDVKGCGLLFADGFESGDTDAWERGSRGFAADRWTNL